MVAALEKLCKVLQPLISSGRLLLWLWEEEFRGLIGARNFPGGQRAVGFATLFMGGLTGSIFLRHILMWSLLLMNPSKESLLQSAISDLIVRSSTKLITRSQLVQKEHGLYLVKMEFRQKLLDFGRQRPPQRPMGSRVNYGRSYSPSAQRNLTTGTSQKNSAL